MHVRYMMDRAEHLARRRADPRPCVACRLARPGGNRSPHPAALARRLPMAGFGERWAVVRSALQFTVLFQRGVPGLEPASYETTGVHSTFQLTVRAHGRSPNFLVFFVLPVSRCAGPASTACLDGYTSFSPEQGNGKQ